MRNKSGEAGELHSGKIYLPVCARCHTRYGMKMTMHIDEELLKRVMAHHEFESKTEAVDFALREIDRKARLRAYAKSGLGMSAEELKAGVYPDYDVVALRVAEAPAKYGKKRAPRR